MKTENLTPSDVHSYPSGYELAYPECEHIRSRVVFDGGNRFLKWVDTDGVVQCIPSCIKECSEYQWKRLKPDPQTVLIEVDGKRYAIGKLAQDLGGDPTFQKDKCELAEILALAAIEPIEGSDFVHISQFAIALPNSLNDADLEAVKRLENHPDYRVFKRNGIEICYTIRSVEPLDETYPAFYYAKSQSFFSFPDHKNAIWDIGGGTSIARIYLPNGTLVEDGEVILPGTKALAQQVAVELQHSTGMDYTPKLEHIMDAIQRGDFLYSTDHIDFRAIYQKVCEQWVESARSEIRSKWAEHLPSLGEVLITGGSAHLAAPICEASGERFKIAPNPQLFNIVAMANMEA